MRHALVTGGTGFVGGAVVDRLLADGWRVTLLARDPGRVHARHQGRVAVLEADLSRDLPALPASDVVFHCAADMELGHGAMEMGRTTVAGTERMLKAAKAAGCGRFVHVSSQAVYGFNTHYYDAPEDTPMPVTPYAYCETKRLAEEAVWQAGREGLEVCVLRPGFVYGRGDMRTLPPVVKALRLGQLKQHVDGGGFDTGCVHVDNCADGIVLAGTVPAAAGQAYHLGDGRVLTIRALTDDLCRGLGVPAPTGSIPFRLAMVLGRVVEGGWKLLRLKGPPPMSPFLVAMLHRNAGFSIEKARRELGYEPRRQWEESVSDVLAWCREVA